MRIELVIEGGFAAIPGLPRPTLLDAATAPAAVRDEVGALVNAALAEQRNTVACKPCNFPDARRYHLTIVRDDRKDVLVGTDSAMPPALNKLLHYVREHGKR